MAQGAAVAEPSVDVPWEQSWAAVQPAAKSAPTDGAAPWEQNWEGHQTSAGQALAEGYLDTASFGFRDEVKAMSEASGLPSWLGGFRAPVGAARLGLEKLRGEQGGPIEQAYDKGLEETRATQKAAEAQHPTAFMTGQLGGALVPFGGAGAAKAATMGGRALRSAIVGAAGGAAYGLGSGEGLSDRLTQAATGGVLGGVTGGALSPVADVAGFGLGKVAEGTKSIIDMVRAEMRPGFVDDRASAKIVQHIASDIQAHGPAWGPAEIAAANQAGIPRAVVDVGSEGTTALGRSAANQSPEARQALEEFTRERFAGQSRRVADFIKGMVGGPGATAQLDALQAAAQRGNRPAYAKAYADGSSGVWSPELERLAGSPAVSEAMRSAATRGQDRAIADGFGGLNQRVTFTPDGRIQFQGRGGVPTYPDLQFWDYTYRALRDAGDAAFRQGRNSEGSAIKALSGQMRGELDNLVPSYKTARAGAAEAFGAENALEAGQKFVSAKGENADYAKAIGKFSPDERKLFGVGFASDLADRVLELRDGQNVLNQAFLQSPAAKQRIAMALGPNRSRELEAMLRAETLADRMRIALGGSTTSRQLAEMGLAAGGLTLLGHEGLDLDPAHMMGAALLFGGAYAKHRSHIVEKSIARRVGEMLTSQDPAILRRGIQIVAKNKGMMDALRTAGDAVFDRTRGVYATTGQALPAVNEAIGGVTGQNQ